MDLTLLDPWVSRSKPGKLRVIIETPRGSRNKYTYEHIYNLFVLSKVLPEGMSFPYDFGFIPHTLAPDGDPVDIMVMLDEPAFTGCLAEVRVIGMIEAVEKKKDDKAFNGNNRLLGVAESARLYQSIKDITDLDSGLLDELEHFFVAYSEVEEKIFKPKSRKGSAEAIDYIKEHLK